MREHLRAVLSCLIMVAAFMGACASGGGGAGFNPSFPLSDEEARAHVQKMRNDRRAPERPVLIIGGLYDPGFAVDKLTREVKWMLARGSPVVSVGMFGTSSMAACRDRVLKTLEEALPSDDPEWTVEVDVIGFSLGGVVAQDAAMPAESGEPMRKRLRIARLFTIAAPLRGAEAADAPSPDGRIRAIRPGSEFLRRLESAEVDYEIIPYVRLGDSIVGEPNAAPRGEQPYWIANLPFSGAHADAAKDPRILADIGRRLRGETPLTGRERAPLP